MIPIPQSKLPKPPAPSHGPSGHQRGSDICQTGETDVICMIPACIPHRYRCVHNAGLSQYRSYKGHQHHHMNRLDVSMNPTFVQMNSQKELFRPTSYEELGHFFHLFSRQQLRKLPYVSQYCLVIFQFHLIDLKQFFVIRAGEQPERTVQVDQLRRTSSLLSPSPE